MGFGGRPQEEGGHAPVKLSLNEGIRKCLQKVEGRDEVVSQFVEKFLDSPCKQLDPGPSCADVSDVIRLLDGKLASAYQRRDYGRMQVLSAMREQIEPFVAVCGLKTKPNTVNTMAETTKEASSSMGGQISG